MSEIDLPPGFTDRYRPDKLLGVGTMGAVYLAVRIETGEQVAVKFLTEIDSPLLLERFIREGRLMASIDHPNVVRVHEASDAGGNPYLVSEYVSGGTLKEFIARRQRLEPAEAIRLALDILAGLAACHQKSVVHRDVKPANILLTPDGRAKIADLGIAREGGGQGPALTKTGAILGTPIYMAPEMIQGEKAVVASDLYGVGVILYEMLAGKLPFFSRNVGELFRMHLQDPPPPFDDKVPAPLSEIVCWPLRKQAADRPRSAEELALALRRFQTTGTFSPPTPRQAPRPPAAQPQRPSNRVAALPAPATPTPAAVGPALPPSLVVVCLVSAALGALVATVALRRPDPAPTPVPTATSTTSPAPLPSIDVTVPATPSPLSPLPPRPTPSAASSILDTLVDEVRSLRDRTESRPVSLKKFLPNEDLPGAMCPLVVACPLHVESVLVTPAPDTTVVLSFCVTDVKRTFAFKDSGISPGLNWVRMVRPKGEPAAVITIVRGPCNGVIRADRRFPRGIALYRRTDEILQTPGAVTGESAARALIATDVLTTSGVDEEAAVQRLVLLGSQGVADALDVVTQVSDDPVWADTERLRAAMRGMDAFQKALEEDPQKWYPWHDISWALYKSGQDEAARAAVVQALMLWPRAHWSWEVIGRIERRVYLATRRLWPNERDRLEPYRTKALKYFRIALELRQQQLVNPGGLSTLKSHIAELEKQER